MCAPASTLSIWVCPWLLVPRITSLLIPLGCTKDNPRRSWVDYDFEDDASSSRPHGPWTRGDDVPGGPSRANEIEEEESEDGDDDEESDDEPADAASSEE